MNRLFSRSIRGKAAGLSFIGLLVLVSQLAQAQTCPTKAQLAVSPASQTICQAGTIDSFTATVVSNTVTSQQWYITNVTGTSFTTISGATSLTFSPAVAQQPAVGATRYYAIIGQNGTVACGDTAYTSLSIRPTVTLTFTAPANNAQLCGNSTTTFTVTSNAVAPDSIRLVYFDDPLTTPADAYTASGTELATVASTSATGNKTLTFSNVLLPDNLSGDNDTITVYALLVSASGACQPVAQRTIILRPRPVTSIAVDPLVCQGTSATLVASGEAGTTYRFLLNGTPIAGAAGAANPYITAAINTTATYGVLATLNTCVSDTVEVTLTPVPCTPCVSTTTSLGGVVYRDYNNNGVNNTETGFAGVTVTVSRCDATGGSVQVAQVQTDLKGQYSVTGLVATTDYRVEFSNLPADFEPTARGSQNGTTVQFTRPGSCSISLGLNQPFDYCQTNPLMATSCYVNGASTNTTAPLDVLISFNYDNSGTTPNPNHLASKNEIGSTWGLAYDRYTKQLFSSTFLKRHTGIKDNDGNGLADLGVIYVTSNLTATPTNAVWVDLAKAPYNQDLGTLPNDAGRGLGLPTAPNADPLAFTEVGKIALGDLDISEDGKNLWTVNINQHRLLKIAINPDGSAGALTSYDLPIPCASLTNKLYINSGNNTGGFTGGFGGDGFFINGAVVATGRPGVPYSTARQGTSVQYRVSVPNGSYSVVLYFGTNIARNQTNTVEATTQALTLPANQTATQTFTVAVSDGTLDVSLSAVTGTASIAGIEITSLAGATLGREHYAFGTKYYNGAMYVGITCNAEFSQNRNNLQSVVYRLPDDGSTTFTPVVTVPLTYAKGRSHNGPCGTQWLPWLVNTKPVNCNDNLAAYPTPILSDIEFDVNGDMIMGFIDRAAHQWGYLNYYPNGTLSEEYADGGDVLRAQYQSPTSFILENNGRVGALTGAPNNNQGPGGGEFYSGEQLAIAHFETSLGGLALLPGRNELALTGMDPVNINSQGVYYLSNTNGTRADAYQIINATTGNRAFFGKAAGLGDLELFCDIAPIQIGNRVFRDINRNGIQDPCEPPIAGAVVVLYDAAKTTALASVTTNAAGEYYFGSPGSTSANSTSSVSTSALSYSTTYGLVITSLGSGTAATGLTLTDVSPVTPGESGTTNSGTTQINNDAKVDVVGGISRPCIRLTTGGPGENNHTYDFGLAPCIPPSLTALASSGTVCLGSAVTLTAQVSPAGSYTYTMSGPAGVTLSTTTSATAVATNLALGLNTFTITVGSSPTCFTTATVSVSVVAPPSVSLTSGTVCAGQPVSLTASGAGAGATYVFSTSGAIGNILTITPTVTAAFTVTATTAGGCSATATATVTVNPLPVATLTQNTSVCIGQPVTLTATGGTSYTFSTGLVNTTGLLTFTPASTTVISVTVANASGCRSTTTATVTVNPLPVATLTPATICAGETATLTATGGTSYTFSTGLTNLTGLLTLTPTSTTTISVTVASASGCRSTTTATVTVNPLPTLVTSVSCVGIATYTVSFTTTPGAVVTTSTGIIVGNTVVGITSGQSVTLTTTLNGCSVSTQLVQNCASNAAGLGDFVFEDTNRDGTQDAGEPPIPNVTVTLYLNGVASATTVTNASGLYSFTGLTPGSSTSYSVGFTTPANYTATGANLGGDDTEDSDALPATGRTQSVTLANGEFNPTLDAGFFLIPARLGDFVFADNNRNGIQDAGDTPIPNVMVTLLSGTTVAGITLTDVNGLYSFTGLTPGVPYSVSFTTPTGYSATLQNIGPDVTDSDGNPATGLTGTYSLTPGENNPTVDMGYFRPASLGDFVFVDTNQDGVQNGGDTPIPGVIVTLLDGTNTPIASTTTNASGLYSFTGLTPGVPYSVSFTTPAGYSATAPNVGANDGLDSDPVGGVTAPVTLTSGENNTTLDAGFYLPCSLSATVTAGVCASATNTYSATVTATVLNPSGGQTLTISNGAISQPFTTTGGSSNTFTAIFNGLTSDGASHSITATLPGCGSATATYTAPVACSLTPVCTIVPVVTPGLCASATNTYSATAVVQLTNPPAGVLTVSTGGQSLTTTITGGLSSFTYTALFSGLISDGASHTVTASLPGCADQSVTYTAPASCSVAPVCSISATVSVGLCSTATNTFSTTATVTVTNPSAGTLTVLDGAISRTFTTTAGASNTFTVINTGITSNGSVHTVTASVPGCSSATATYTAPASCTIAPVCSVSITATAGVCNPATNTYSVTAVVTAQNPVGGATLTISNGAISQPFTTTAGTSNTFTTIFAGLPSDGANHILTASLPGCSTATTLYTAPVSCSVAPVCSVGTPVITPGVCNSATNTYSVTAVVTIQNTTAGVLTVTNGGQSLTTTVTGGLSSFTYTAIFINQPSDGLTQTLMALLPGCGSQSATYTAPVSCSVTPLCAVGTPVVTVGPCLTATNTYSTTAVVTVQNPTNGGTLTISNGVTSQPFTTTAGTSNTFTMVFTGLTSTGASQTITASLPGCGSATATYTAPASCSVAPVCTINPVVTPGLCNAATNTYSATTVVQLSNPPAGLLTVSNGASSLTATIASGLTTFTFTATFNGLTSDGSLHTVVASLPGCASATVSYTAPVACSVGVAITVTPGVCNTATNQYDLTGMLSLTNATAGTATITDGTSVTTVSIPAGATSVGYALSGLNSGTGSHTVTVSYAGTGASVTYTAPASCTVLDLALTKTILAGQSSTVTAGSSVTFTITVVNQGTVPATTISLVDYIPAGLTLSDPNWTTAVSGSGTIATLNTPIASLSAGASTIRTIGFTVNAGITGQFVNRAEISGNSGGNDIDSNPDSDPANDAGGAPNSPADDVITGNGTGTPGDTNPATDEDDADPALITVIPAPAFDLALRKTLAPGQAASVTPGSSVTFTVTVVNQGNVLASTINLVDYIPAGLTLSDPNWTTAVSGSGTIATLNTPIASLSAGASTTRTIIFTVNTGVTGELVNRTEISSATGGTDVDSSPDTNPVNDAGGAANSGSDDALNGDGTGTPGGSTAATDEDDADPAIITVTPTPVCSINPVVTVGPCLTATSTYSTTAVVTLANTTAGILTVTNGTQSLTTSVAGGLTSFTFTAVFNGLLPDGSSQTITASLPGCDTATATYTSPESCSLGIALTATPGTCETATNGYIVTGTLSLTNAPAGTATLTDGTVSTTLAVTTGTTSLPYSLSGLNSGTGSHTITVSFASQVASVTYTAPVSCSVNPPCLLSLVITPGACNTATNQYSLTGSVSATNAVGSQVVTVTDGAISTTVALTGNGPTSFTLIGLSSDGAFHSVATSAATCGLASQTYTAPASCTVAPASLGDFVFADNNGNGVQDGTDTPIPGVTVTLLDGLNTPINSTTTDVNGLYSFTDLTPGVPYSVSFTTPLNYSATTPNVGNDVTDSDPVGGLTAPVTLTSGENNTTLDAGFFLPTAQLGDFVFEDSNRNGQQNTGEPGIPNVSVSLLSSGTVVASTTTEVNGLYSFTGLTPGVPYSVSFTAPTGYSATLQNIGPDATDSDGNPATGLTGVYSLAANENNPTLDMGYFRPASLGDFVFADNNQNGIQDGGDTPIAGVTVTLLDGTNTAIASTTTTVNGLYSFTGLTPGVPYSVSFTTPAGYSATVSNAGNDVTDSDPVGGVTAPLTLTSGENNITLDAGYSIPKGSIGSIVFTDVNRNGQRDPEDGGIDGVTVRLLRETTPGNYTVVSTTITSGGGLYLFPNLPAGTYVVEFDNTTLPPGYFISPNPNRPGVPANVNSDADPLTGRSAPITLVPGDPNQANILAIDAGLETNCPPATCVPLVIKRIR
ncbi:SdrD B-like domain-containing protein [Spirosoma areae]